MALASCGLRTDSRISFEVAAPSYYTRDFRSEGQPFWPGARRHDGASLTTSALAGLAAAVVVPARARGLVGGRRADGGRPPARCVELLSAVPGVTLQAETEGAAPLVAFTVAGHSAEDVIKALEAKGVLARSLPGLDWVRVSLGYWLSDADLDRLADALRSLASA